MRTLLASGVACLFLITVVHAQKLASITVSSGSYERLNSVVSASLDGYVLETEDFDLELREWSGGKLVPVPSQLEGGIN
ncbi:MAG: hypothetical protein KDC80_25990, partial [Saprospiraceae bacterium]|nr:hypothetical protein [Saprospiraceae bacterium]